MHQASCVSSQFTLRRFQLELVMPLSSHAMMLTIAPGQVLLQILPFDVQPTHCDHETLQCGALVQLPLRNCKSAVDQ